MFTVCISVGATSNVKASAETPHGTTSTFSLKLSPHDTSPKTLNLRDLIKYFIEHRHEVVIRRTQFDLRKAKERAHILEGLIIASDNIDEVIRIIRAAKTPNDAIAGLIERFNLTEIQSRAIVEMRLRQLTGLMQDQLHAEYEEIMKQIAYLESILADDEVCRQVMKDELLEVKTKYGDERRSEIVYSSEEFNPEDFYADDQMIITISHMGYIKRTPLTEFRAYHVSMRQPPKRYSS